MFAKTLVLLSKGCIVRHTTTKPDERESKWHTTVLRENQDLPSALAQLRQSGIVFAHRLVV
jgi:hypothetical protein